MTAGWGPRRPTPDPEGYVLSLMVAEQCVCGHLVAVHNFSGKKERTSCTRMDASGPCGCKRCEVAS